MKKKRNSLIGLEVNQNEVRMVEVAYKANSVQVTASGAMPLPAGCIVDDAIVNTQLLTDTIRAIYRGSNFHAKEVVIGLDGTDVLFRSAQFVKVAPDKQKNMILLQAQEFMPVSMAEMELDYTVVGTTTDESGVKLDTFLVAAKRNLIEKQIEACTNAKLSVLDVTASLTMLATTLLEHGADQSFALVKTDVNTVNILFVHDGLPVFARTIAVAVQTAETKDAWQADVAREIRSSVTYYNSRNQQSFDNIVLLQQEGDPAGLSEIIEQGNILKVQRETPFDEWTADISERNVQGCIAIAINRLGGE